MHAYLIMKANPVMVQTKSRRSMQSKTPNDEKIFAIYYPPSLNLELDRATKLSHSSSSNQESTEDENTTREDDDISEAISIGILDRSQDRKTGQCTTRFN